MVGRHRLSAALLLVVGAALSGSGNAAMFSADCSWGDEGLQTNLSLERPEGERLFDVYIPKGLQDNPALVLDLHSKGTRKEYQRERSRLHLLAEERKDFIVV